MNKQRFYLRMVTGSLLRRRSRMIVALLAVALGATILSGLVAIYYDIPRQMGQEFRSYGTNLVILPAGNTAMSREQVERATALLPRESLVGAAPYRYQVIKINDQPFMAAGSDLEEVRKTSPYWYIQGRWPESPGEALIGAEVAERILLVAGSPFTIKGMGPDGIAFGRDFTVSGILQTGGSEEAFVFMTTADFEGMTGKAGLFDVVECSVALSGEALENTARRISAEDGVEGRLVKRVTESEGTVLAKLKALVFLVTAIILILITICVATTMMAVVAERRREIGLRKALGASDPGIIREFLGEGIFLGGLGGILGACFGIVFAQAAGFHVFNRAINFTPLLLPATVIASVIITGVACMIPVRMAVDVDPAIVLRGE